VRGVEVDVEQRGWVQGCFWFWKGLVQDACSGAACGCCRRPAGRAFRLIADERTRNEPILGKRIEIYQLAVPLLRRSSQLGGILQNNTKQTIGTVLKKHSATGPRPLRQYIYIYISSYTGLFEPNMHDQNHFFSPFFGFWVTDPSFKNLSKNRFQLDDFVQLYVSIFKLRKTCHQLSHAT
jgi:hypothetical protein